MTASRVASCWPRRSGSAPRDTQANSPTSCGVAVLAQLPPCPSPRGPVCASAPPASGSRPRSLRLRCPPPAQPLPFHTPRAHRAPLSRRHCACSRWQIVAAALPVLAVGRWRGAQWPQAQAAGVGCCRRSRGPPGRGPRTRADAVGTTAQAPTALAEAPGPAHAAKGLALHMDGMGAHGCP